MKIFDLLDTNELSEMIEDKFVKVQKHPTYDLYIYNYTEKAVVFNVWNDVTKTCRGLIVDDVGEIIARPFPKFFNHDQKESKTYRENEKVVVTDKMDGSLGILYRNPDGFCAIATRGSFTSDQAIHATKILYEKYSDAWFRESETWLFEIIYPENRIVVDYDGMDDLVLLGAVDKEQGLIYTSNDFDEDDWSGPKAEQFEFASFSEALSAPPRPGREGLVVHFQETDTMVKIKQEDYLRLHRIVTGLNEHVIWEHIQKRWMVHDLIGDLPDEFHQWVIEVSERMFDVYCEMENEVLDRFDALNEAGLVEEERKEFALAVKDLAPWLKSSLFLMLDGKDFSKILWKQVEPKKDTFVR